jgi:hypothetical protein
MTEHSDGFERLKAILQEKLPDAEVQVIMAELAIAFGNGSVAITGDATNAVTLTGSQNIGGDHNQVVINQGITSEELSKIFRQLLQQNASSANNDKDVTFDRCDLPFECYVPAPI